VLDQLRAEALTCVGAAGRCVLSTAGPAGPQASVVPCVILDDCIYLLIPSTADVLFNLEHVDDVVLTTPEWQLHGVALVLNEPSRRQGHPPATLCRQATAEGTVVAEVFPLRIHLEPGRGAHRITIDFSLPPALENAEPRRSNVW
jgi:hypothetical protein